MSGMRMTRRPKGGAKAGSSSYCASRTSITLPATAKASPTRLAMMRSRRLAAGRGIDQWAEGEASSAERDSRMEVSAMMFCMRR